MIEDIGAGGHDLVDAPWAGGRTSAQKAGGIGGRRLWAEGSETELPSGLRDLARQVAQVPTFRQDRVRQVMEKLDRGELTSSASIRGSAEIILMGGI